MMTRFQYGTVVSFQAGEELKNNDLLIICASSENIWSILQNIGQAKLNTTQNLNSCEMKNII